VITEMTAQQRELRDAVARFAMSKLADGLKSGESHMDLWRYCAEFGILGLAVPQAYGGSGLDALSVTHVMEELGRRCPHSGLLFSLGAQMWACQHPILHFGTEAQRQRYLPLLSDGTLIAAHAMTEAASGSDAFALRTRASRHGSRWILDGVKTFITNAPIADLFVVFATLDAKKGFSSLCAFLVPRNSAGIVVGPAIRLPGLNGSEMAEVSLNSCEVGENSLLGRPGSGMAIFSSTMRWERALIMSCTVGAMERQLAMCAEYTTQRKTSGQPIGFHQAVAHKIVDMRTRLDTARLLIRRAAKALDEADKQADLYAAMAKLHVSEAFVASSLDAIQIHGAYGLTDEAGLSTFLYDALASRVYSGTSEILRNYIARRIGLPGCQVKANA
jgi:alkylation response protein AidB-like acyl-CoA dehydrogenase